MKRKRIYISIPISGHDLEKVKEKAMKIPNKIRIGGQDIVIEMPEHLPDNKLGDICVAGGKIRIAKKFSDNEQSETSITNTFMHEVVHGVLDTMGEFELSRNENFVSPFASLMVDVIEEIVKVNKEECINGKSE